VRTDNPPADGFALRVQIVITLAAAALASHIPREPAANPKGVSIRYATSADHHGIACGWERVEFVDWCRNFHSPLHHNTAIARPQRLMGIAKNRPVPIFSAFTCTPPLFFPIGGGKN